MQILSGDKKGSILAVPKEGTRPTTNKIKKSLFDSIQYRLEESVVLDLFAGSGALGLEALSRKAAFAVFVEKDFHAIECIKKNIEKLDFKDRTEVLQINLNKPFQSDRLFDLIFIDPPYDFDCLEICIEALKLLKPDGLMVVEQSKRTRFLDPLVCSKKKEFGDTVLYFFEAVKL
jgi:16S rRNA (guanine966-N2)-methyltransferase